MLSEHDIAAVVRWLAEHGFVVEHVDRDRGTATVRLWPEEE